MSVTDCGLAVRLMGVNLNTLNVGPAVSFGSSVGVAGDTAFFTLNDGPTASFGSSAAVAGETALFALNVGPVVSVLGSCGIVTVPMYREPFVKTAVAVYVAPWTRNPSGAANSTKLSEDVTLKLTCPS